MSSQQANESPTKFLKPADLFKARRRSHLEPQSPLKSINLHEASPVKKLPLLLKNPFGQSVKRKLDLNRQSSTKSNVSRNLDVDEDANLEPPKLKRNKLLKTISSSSTCYKNSWALRTKLRIGFESPCKNWDHSSTSTHKRRIGAAVFESPSKSNDKTISLEAIKNFSTVYQHPYFSWMPLYPRESSKLIDRRKQMNHFKFSSNTQAVEMMHKDWCESLDDLANLIIEGKCPFFYLCSDLHNILFKQTKSTDDKSLSVQIYISPLSCGLGMELNKMGIDFRCPDITQPGSSNSGPRAFNRDCSQTSFGSSQTRSSTINQEDNSSQDMSLSQSQFRDVKKTPPSVDSGNISDFEDDLGQIDDENEDASQILTELLGASVSQTSFRGFEGEKRSFVESDSNTQTKSKSSKPLARIEGIDNLKKLVKFLKRSQMYTISTVGKFAFIPPTLLSPREFRLSTPQCPTVTMNKNMIDYGVKRDNSVQKLGLSSRDFSATNRQLALDEISHVESSRLNDIENSPRKMLPKAGPSFIELNGTILPNLYVELEKLLKVSNNSDHNCQSTQLESSIPFESINFTL